MAEQNNQLAAALSKKLKKDDAADTAGAADKVDKADKAGVANATGEKDKRAIVLDIVEDATGIEREELEGSKRLGDDLNTVSYTHLTLPTNREV